MVSSYRTFDFLPSSVLPDQKLVVFARSDFAFLGMLHSRIHDVWTEATCSWIGAGNDVTYSNTAVFETFPFPDGLTPAQTEEQWRANPRGTAVAAATEALITLRNSWLFPEGLTSVVAEVVEGYPERVIPVDERAANELAQRTLGQLYAHPPAWLVDAHRLLDEAVAAAYGWSADLADSEILARLLALNLERSAVGSLV